MNRTEFLPLNDKPCRFKLKGGKEIFGIIWENNIGKHPVHYFSSTADRMRYKFPETVNSRISFEKVFTPVHLEDIVQAEPLS